MLLHSKHNGFTLVELLIVITIIGFLASVVLSRLQDARDDGIDTKIKTELIVIGKRAAIEESKNLTYDIVCGTNSYTQAESIADQIRQVEGFSGETVTCRSNVDAFAVSVPVGSGHWCVDSAGNRKEILNALGVGEYTCP